MTTPDNMDTQAPAGATRCGFVALIGAPNAGKSTLLNQLVGMKVAIVTPKVQTTRARLRAIAVHGPSQLVFVDTPGIFKPRRTLDKAMVEAAWAGAEEADIVLLLVDSRTGLDEEVEAVLDALAASGLKAQLVLNKVDAVKRESLLALSAALNERVAFENTFMISALTGDGVDDLRAFLADHMPEGPWLYPEDQIADVPLRLMASEVTREKLFLRLHQELPYASTVETESWTEKPDGSVRIEQVIYVERDGQKKIVLGKGGRSIKEIGQAAREELQEMLGKRVHLFLFVKVRENWGRDPERFQMMGLDFPR
ncbi:GTPase Era [Kaustia mangrovi]|uniref:GTPase Era n=1 Tax=Kaustia mangrovi TaxID=2593653 RepID=A0A7S8C1R1_9HYPH|nr:GTPase Era [Kaustia mangrovi]QPC41785.1 GTPase Era [Kaustia mangrovi]